MRTKLLSALLLLSLTTASCGLKRAPTAPKNTNLPTIPDQYMYKLKPDEAGEKEKREKDEQPQNQQSKSKK